MIEPVEGGVHLHVLVQPRASRSEIVGPIDGRLKVRLAAPPVEGQANDALTDFLAEALDLPRSAVTVRRGHRSRRKTVMLRGLSDREARERLGT